MKELCKDATFNQKVSAFMAVLFFAGLMCVLFIPMKGNPQFSNGIIIAFSSSMTACLGYLIGSSSGSHAKDEAQNNTTKQLVDNLANSVPVVAKTNP